MAALITGGESTMLALMHGADCLRPNEEVLGNLKNFADSLTGGARDFGQRLMTTYRDAYSNQEYNRAVFALENTKQMYTLTPIKPLATVAEFQSANVDMQRWLTSSPVVYGKITSQNIYGWNDTLVIQNQHPDPEWRTDYQLVNDGVLKFNNKSEQSEDWVIECYATEPDSKLSFRNQMDIRYSCDVLEQLLEYGEGEDPTSPYKDKL